MRHLDISFEGRRLADRNQLDNGKLPHGGYRGSKRHPMCHLSFDKGREFQHKIQEEIDHLLITNELALQGTTPSWSLLVHREPSYSDESPLHTNQYLATSKLAPSNGVTLQNRLSLLPQRKMFKPQRRTDTQFYRPNSTHQYLSATELKNASEGDVNILYGRPTRTTLLRARQRCTSAPNKNHVRKKEPESRVEDFKSCYSVPSNTETIQLERDGETLHSFLTGARYNRAHCLDARSVDHTGVYMPRNNTALGCFFTGPKGHEYLKEFDEPTPRSEGMPSPRAPSSPKRRPTTAPGLGKRSVMLASPASPPRPRQAWTFSAGANPKSPRYKTLNVVGCRLPIGLGKEMTLRLPFLQQAQQPTSASKKTQGIPMEESYRGYQPPPTPTSLLTQEHTERRLDGYVLEADSKPVTQVAVSLKNGRDESFIQEHAEEEERLEDKEEPKEKEVEEEEEVKEAVDDNEIVEVQGDTAEQEEDLDEKQQLKEEKDAEEKKESDENDNYAVDNNANENEPVVNPSEEEKNEDQLLCEEEEEEEEEFEEDEENDDKPVKEVRFFITEKDQEGAAEKGDFERDDENEDNNDNDEERTKDEEDINGVVKEEEEEEVDEGLSNQRGEELEAQGNDDINK